MNGAIRIADPTKIGPALADLRNMLGIGRRQFARVIAPKANRTEDSVTSQLFKWDRGTVHPGGAALRLVLDELGYDLALVPREDAQPTGTWCNGRSTLVMAICGNQKPHGPHERCERIDCDHWHCEGRA